MIRAPTSKIIIIGNQSVAHLFCVFNNMCVYYFAFPNNQYISHSDGIRGFFATYLTSPESLTVDYVPEVLAEAVRNSDPKTMVPLACMNVIMPTAMSSLHQDAELRECASKTAGNGLKILRLLKGNEEVVRNCKAIMIVCQGTGEGPEDEFFEVMIQVSASCLLFLVNLFFSCTVPHVVNLTFLCLIFNVSSVIHQYWNNFFDGYKYGEKQKEDIATVMSEFC